MDKRLLRKKVESAKVRVTDARTTIEALLAEIRVLPRAEKMTISSTVEDAFEKLRAALSDLQELETLVKGDRD
ncbi:MAG TPA: hypothetical protein VK524_26450 [Polyangiaceae bacterium]|nr:hypothetical protein [Polyangiaceae bacterium]